MQSLPKTERPETGRYRRQVIDEAESHSRREAHAVVLYLPYAARGAWWDCEYEGCWVQATRFGGRPAGGSS